MVVQIPLDAQWNRHTHEGDARGEQSSRVSILLVSDSAADYMKLSSVCKGSCWLLQWVRSIPEAKAFLERSTVDIAICDYDASKGSWADLIGASSGEPHGPEVIVACTGLDGQIWAEALNLGARDVLIKPFEPAEVMHVVHLAWFAAMHKRGAPRNMPVIAGTR